MAIAFERLRARRGATSAASISAGGSGGTALATQAMRALPVGMPKVMVSTVASGDVRPYVGPSDICMMYSVTDVSGINRISEKVLANAAHALAGMIAYTRTGAHPTSQARDRPDDVRRHHAVRAGGDQAAAETTTTAWSSTPPAPAASRWRSWSTRACSPACSTSRRPRSADEIVGGVLSARARSGSMPFARAAIPYVGSCGALDMVNFWALGHRAAEVQGPQLCQAQPERHADAHHAGRVPRDRRVHRGQAESHGGPGALPDSRGRRVGARRSRASRSGIPAADKALFDGDRAELPSRPATGSCMRLPLHLNDPAFADAAGRSSFTRYRRALPHTRCSH